MYILKNFYKNTRKPQKGLGGKIMLWLMNLGHNKSSIWGWKHLEIPSTANILDVGCGGGRNIANLLNKANKGKVYGIDYSQASVKKSKLVNKTAIFKGKTEIFLGNISSLPLDNRDRHLFSLTSPLWSPIIYICQE